MRSYLSLFVVAVALVCSPLSVSVSASPFARVAEAQCTPNAETIPCLVNPLDNCASILCATNTQCVQSTCQPCSVVCAPIKPTPTRVCSADSDCKSGRWCKLGKCVAFAKDGQSCGGKVLPEFQQQCKPTSTCFQSRVGVADIPGVCTPSCRSNTDCKPTKAGEQQYCSTSSVCLPVGKCTFPEDCSVEGNSFISIQCVGTFTCNADKVGGTCGKVCDVNGPV